MPAEQVMPAVLEGTGGKEVSLEDATRSASRRSRRRAAVPDLLPREGRGEGRGAGRAVRRPARAQDRAASGFGRIAAQTAKQVIHQRVREAERDNVFNEYKDRKGEIITGIVRRFERGNIIVDLGRAEAVLPVREQVPRESVPRRRPRSRPTCLDIDRNARGPQIILSRTHKGLLEKLFEMEVPEIDEKIVRIEAAAREPGARAKIAVSARATATSTRSAPASA